MWMDDRITLPLLDKRHRCVVQGSEAKRVALTKPHDAEFGFANSGRVSQHSIEHRLKFAGRAADDAQHLGGRGLLLQGFAQFIEQPDVLNRDHRLAGKVLDQLDLLIAEWLDLLAINVERADQFVLLEHRHKQKRPHPADVC